MPIAYCPKCEKKVTTTREDIDAGLAIFLFCCTGGIGLLVYLLIYFQKNETQCIFCSSETVPNSQDPLIKSTQNLPTINNEDGSSYIINNDSSIDDSSGKFCPFCGISLKGDQNYCENCGGDLSETQKN